MSVVVIGAGGHARVVVDALRASGRDIYGLLDADPDRHGETYEGAQIRGGDALLPELFQRGVTEFIVGIGSIGRPSARIRAYDMGLSFGFVPATAIHPSSTVAASARLGSGTLVAAGVVINPATTVGINSIVNSMALVEHDVEVGDHVHLAPGSRVLGGCRVGSRTHIGAGAVILQGVTIGDDVMVAAGAVVIGDVPDGATVMGVPARPRGESGTGL